MEPIQEWLNNKNLLSKPITICLQFKLSLLYACVNYRTHTNWRGYVSQNVAVNTSKNVCKPKHCFEVLPWRKTYILSTIITFIYTWWISMLVYVFKNKLIDQILEPPLECHVTGTRRDFYFLLNDWLSIFNWYKNNTSTCSLMVVQPNIILVVFYFFISIFIRKLRTCIWKYAL